MSRLREIVVEGESKAPPDAVWKLLSDTPSYTRWAGASEAVVECGHGVGEQRWVHASGLTTHERVTTFDPPRHYTYELLSGAPIRDYRSDVTLEPTAAGTHIRWDAHFRSEVPFTGWALRSQLHRMVARAVDGLARVAEADARPGG